MRFLLCCFWTLGIMEEEEKEGTAVVETKGRDVERGAWSVDSDMHLEPKVLLRAKKFGRRTWASGG